MTGLLLEEQLLAPCSSSGNRGHPLQCVRARHLHLQALRLDATWRPLAAAMSDFEGQAQQLQVGRCSLGKVPGESTPRMNDLLVRSAMGASAGAPTSVQSDQSPHRPTPLFSACRSCCKA
jgi:hypothetical protein